MDTNTPQSTQSRSARTLSNCSYGFGHPFAGVRILVAVFVIVTTNPVAAQTRQGGHRATPDQVFETVWVVDREMPALAIWQTLTHVTASEVFQPVVLHGGEDPRWTESLEHLLSLLPEGDTVWVSEAETVFNVDDWMTPERLSGLDSSGGPRVYSADESLDAVAALIAMRLDGVLTTRRPTTGSSSVLVGVDEPQEQLERVEARRDPHVYLPTRADALAYANQLAERPVVMVVRSHSLLPEYVLWAFQRDAKILEVDPPAYDIYNAWSESVAVDSVRRQIQTSLPGVLGGDPAEALVIAGDWYEIPFRFPAGGWAPASNKSGGFPGPCTSCDNKVSEFAADLAYANLDNDSHGVPDVPVGRLMSPYRDLLAIQTVVGIWREQGAFPPASDGVFLGLLGTASPYHRPYMFDAWREAFPGQHWSAIGPGGSDPGYHLDGDDFFNIADRAEIVVVHGHGHPDYLSPSGSPFNQAVSGRNLRERATSGAPSFWFLHACGTGKPDVNDHLAEQTLLVGLQSRLAFGALMAVENVSGGSADPYWWIDSVASGLTVGELVRRFVETGAAAYRDGSVEAPGLPGANGSSANKSLNSLGALSWVGDPLTPMATGR